MKTIDNYCYLCAAIKITPSFLNNRERIDFLFAFNKLFEAFSLPHSFVSHLIFCNIVTGFCFVFVFVLFSFYLNGGWMADGWLVRWLTGWLDGWLVSLNGCLYWLVGVRASHTKTNLASILMRILPVMFNVKIYNWFQAWIFNTNGKLLHISLRHHFTDTFRMNVENGYGQGHTHSHFGIPNDAATANSQKFQKIK